MNLIERASTFARNAHIAQFREWTGEPYWNHLHEVAELVRNSGLPDDVVAAAYLHDTIEDTKVTFQDLETHFGLVIAEMVLMVTDISIGTGYGRAVRKRMDCRYLAGASSYGQSIKLADLISNSGSVVECNPKFAGIYLPEKRALLEVLINGRYSLYVKAQETLVAAEQRLKEKGNAVQ